MIQLALLDQNFVFSVGGDANTKNDKLMLWDTVTNDITLEDQPSGLEQTWIFRPSLLPYDDSSFLLVTADTEDSVGNKAFLDSIWQYVYGFGWIELSNSPAPLNAMEQNGLFWLDNDPPINDFESLNRCAF